MKILVTGANGQVGSELVQQGTLQGVQIIATGKAELDITQSEAVKNKIFAEQPNMVINASAYTAVDRAEEEVGQAFAINRNGPEHLALACAEQKIPLLHLSTDYVFDGLQKSPYVETDRPNPSGIYGKSKRDGELAIEAHHDQHYIIRVAWVFGASGQNFVRTMMRLAKAHDNLKVVSDQMGGPTWAQDIARLLLLMAKRTSNNQAIPWGTYHYMGAPPTTWHGFATTLFHKAQELGMLTATPEIKAITTEEYPTPAKRPPNSVLDCEKICRALNITQPDWKIGLEAVLLTWKNQ